MKRTFGLIGYPLGHSFSRKHFTEKFAAEAIDAEYLNFEIPHIEEITEIIKLPQLAGLNVTIPHKLAVIPYLDTLDEGARRIGAVNVVKPIRHADGRIELKGYNTDVVGFVHSLRPLLQPHHTKALVLGTGGASRAIAVGLEQLGIAYTLVSRTPAEGRLTYEQLTPALMQEYTVVVNTTPQGTSPHVEEYPDLPYELFTPQHLCYDLIYNPAETQFLARAKAKGATTMSGLAMLIGQAEAAWHIWNE